LEGLPDSVDFKLRIGYYSKDGNRLGTMFADPDTTIPTPEILAQSQTFLTPKGTTHGKFEIRVLNPTATDITFTIHNLRLFSLKNFATPNSVMVTIPRSTEGEIQEGNGYLWVRSLCSKNGGTVHITTEKFDETLNTTCGPVSKFVWTPLKTTTNLEGMDVTITNKTGINAINALMWISDAEMAKLQQETLQKIQSKTMLHLIDSVDLDSNGAVESHHIDSDWIGGTTLRGLNSTVFTTVDIVKDGTYALDIMDILPNDDDAYVVTLKSTINSEIVVQSTITPSDERRTPRDATHSGRTRLSSLELKKGQYTLELQLKSQTQPLLRWDDMDNPDVPECVLTDDSTRTRTRTLPMWEKNWGSLNSEIIPYNKRDALMLRFLFSNVDCRSLHGKIRFLDGLGQEVGVTYLDQTAHGTAEPSEYVKYAEPPEGTEQFMVQFMARHMERFSENAQYDIAELNMWAESSAIGIDAIALLETTTTDWTTKDAWKDEQQHRTLEKNVSRGQRAFQLDTSMSQSHRLQFYESPIHHWIMSTGEDRVMPYAINGFAFGIELPENVDELRSEIILNTTWNRGLVLLMLGLMSIVGLSIQINRQPEVLD
jgi:predicted  nucleic acid-binding Zn-ribbon protein